MVAYRSKISTVASGVVATMIVIVRNIRKKIQIEKAIIDRNIMMNLKQQRPYSQ